MVESVLGGRSLCERPVRSRRAFGAVESCFTLLGEAVTGAQRRRARTSRA